MSERAFRLSATAAAVVAFVALAAFQSDVWAGEAPISDTPLYRDYGERILGGDVPYRDVRVEYPPGALPTVVVAAALSDDRRGFDRSFGVLMALSGVAMLGLVGLVLARLDVGRPRFLLGVGIPALAPMLLGPLLLTRYDLLPAALVAGVLAAVAAGRDRLAATALGAAVAVKLYPGVLAPLLVARAGRRRGRREAVAVAAIAAGIVVLSYAAFTVLSPDGVARSVWRQVSRPLQIESLGSSLLLGLHHVADMPLGWESSHGSQNLTGDAAAGLAVALSVVQLTLLVWLWVRYARGPAAAARFVLFSAAALSVFVAFGKVLSPQFLIWLLPVVPLVAGLRGTAASALLVAACLLTRSWFPDAYWQLVREFDGRASALLVARDLCLVALAVLLAWPESEATASRPEPGRSPSPVPTPRRT